MEKKRKQYPTGPQKARLVGLMEADTSLRSGKFSNNFSKKIAETRWRAIACDLNSMGGAVKEWTEWRKCWQDIKSQTKKKASVIRRAHHATGGGPSMKPLSQMEEVVLNTISDASISGHADCNESVVSFRDLNIIDRSFATPDFNIHVEVQDGMPEERCAQEEVIQNINENQTKRLTRAEKAAQDLNELMRMKLAVKQEFYKNYIAEMRRQTDALLKIAENLKK